VVKLPVRGIGAKTWTRCAISRRPRTSLWNGALGCVTGRPPSKEPLRRCRLSLALIDKLAREVQGLDLQNKSITSFKWRAHEHFKKEKASGARRIENLLELVSAARGFSPETEAEAELSPLESFLAHGGSGIPARAGGPL